MKPKNLDKFLEECNAKIKMWESLKIANPSTASALDVMIDDMKTNMDRANKMPDWLCPILVERKSKWLMINPIRNTIDVEKRIIEKYNLTKYDGIIMSNSEMLKEKLERLVFNHLREESEECGFELQTTHSREIAGRVESVVEQPYDNKGLITFKNKTLDWDATFKTRKITWSSERIENHNSVKWDYITQKDILESPKHKEMLDYMIQLFKDWKVSPKIVFKIGAYAMCKKNFADKIFFFEGKGGEGKSEVSLFIRKMFEDSACKTYDPINPALGAEMAFVGSQVVFNDDLEDGKLCLKHIKPAATGGYIDIRPLYQNNRSHQPYATMIFNTNYGLKTGNDATSNALSSRVFVLKFTGPDMRGTPQAQEYKRVNPSENRYFMEVFVSMCVRNMIDLVKDEFMDEESKQANKSDAISSQNAVKQFVDQFDPAQTYYDPETHDRGYYPLPLHMDRYTTVSDLYRYYKNWANHGNYYIFNKTEFVNQFSAITNVETSVKPHSKGGKISRWIDISPLIGGEEDVNSDK